MKLDLSSLINAISQLEIAMDYTNHKHLEDEVSTQLYRSASIQAFEFTFELAIKMLQRYFQLTLVNPDQVSQMTYNELIRNAYEKGLLKTDVATWKQFRQDRGTTSHAYDVRKAIDVFEHIPVFLVEVKFLYGQLYTRIENDNIN